MKGYSCAYRVYHNDLSCSEYCKNEIESCGFFEGLKKTFERFNECKLAAIEIKKKREKMKGKAKNSLADVKSECNKMDNCDKLIFAEMLGEAACCLCSGIS